jgi:hypothetical protein
MLGFVGASSMLHDAIRLSCKVNDLIGGLLFTGDPA